MPPATQLSIDNLNLIILNSPSVHFHIVSQLWSYCRYKICADGGANRLFDTCISANKNTIDFIPDFIVGDLDSARTDVIDYYRFRDFFLLVFGLNIYLTSLSYAFVY